MTRNQDITVSKARIVIDLFKESKTRGYILLVAEIVDVAVNDRTAVVKMVCELPTTRRVRLAGSAYLVGTRVASMVRSNRATIADANLFNHRTRAAQSLTIATKFLEVSQTAPGQLRSRCAAE